MKLNVDGITIETVPGNIADDEQLTAVVNAANAQLRTGGGVAGAIHDAAGPNLARECRELAPIEPGEAVITSAHDLPNKFVIHTLGPVYGEDRPEDHLLARCYRNSLRRAIEHDVDSIGFPAISTGAFGYPSEEAATVALTTVREEASKIETVQQIRFVQFSSSDQELYERKFDELLS
jgi:O-acetyl-ADP-ribose deacetylase (regulator of RNase III)